MSSHTNLVIAEHAQLVFLRKPAGLPVFPPHREPGGPSLLSHWLALRPELQGLAWPSGFEGGIAHRLDNPTSGIVVACTSLASLAQLRAQFQAGVLRKTYQLVSQREVPWDEHRVDLPIAHDRRRRARMVAQRGKSTAHRGRWYPAITSFRRLGHFRWTAVIHSGVTHQIRVHAAFVGLALAGDRLYGGGPLPSEIKAPPGADFMLHHAAISGPDWSSPTLEPPGWWGCYTSGS